MIISADATGKIDIPIYNILERVKSEIPIVPMTFIDGYKFNEALYNFKKWVLADFGEYGANTWKMDKTHFWGLNSEDFPQSNKEEYLKFDNFVRNNKPTVYFKRELVLDDVVDNSIYPIEFPALNAPGQIKTREDFNSRPIEVFFCWGHSHESRRTLHGNIFINSSKSGYGVVDNFYHFEKAITEYKRVWATIQVPHYARIPMEEVLKVNGHSKLSVSLPGAGGKCFRHTESPVNSCMVMRDDPLLWSYQWVHNHNCIKIPFDYDFEYIRGVKDQWKVIETIEQALKNENLYDIYVEGVRTLEKYYLPNYIKNYIEPTINKLL